MSPPPPPIDSFLPRDAVAYSAVHAVVVCLRVCVCVRHTPIMSERLNIGSRKQRHMISYGL